MKKIILSIAFSIIIIFTINAQVLYTEREINKMGSDLCDTTMYYQYIKEDKAKDIVSLNTVGKNLGFPRDLSAFVSLQRLDIFSKEIAKLDTILNQLPLLQYLYVDFCSIKHIDNIPKSTLIKKLVIYGNYIDNIPKDLLQIPSLDYLDVSEQKVEGISFDELDSVSNIKYLDVSKNRVIQLPKKLYYFKKLEHLNLNKTGLEVIDSSFCTIENLEILIISNNAIETLPMCLTELEKLKILDISNNSFKEFPEVLYNMSGLLKLDLRGSLKNLDAVDKMRVGLKMRELNPKLFVLW